MTRRIGVVGLLGGVLVLLVSAVMVAGEAEKPEEQKVTVVGKISVTEDDDWNVTAAKLTTDGGDVYNIVLDEKGKKLAAEMDGAKVQVTGKLALKSEKAKWLTVTSYKEIEEAEGDD